MLKSLIAATALLAISAPAAIAQAHDDHAGRDHVRPPAERLGALDRRLTRAERNGNWEQGSRADHAEGRLDVIEDRVDRRESWRDEAYDRGRRDVIEDRFDRAESRRDRAENVRDRRLG